MVICDLHVVRSAVLPVETDAPLIVDADQVLARPITTQLLEAVARRSKKVAQVFCFFEVNQLAPRSPLNRWRKLPRLASLEYAFGLIASKALDHYRTLPRSACNDKPPIAPPRSQTAG